MINAERFDRLDRLLAEGRVIHDDWGDGKNLACLLLALAPEVGPEGDIHRCPAELFPFWVAAITPAINDNGSDAARPALQRRYADVMRRGSLTLDALGWRRVLARFMRDILAAVSPPSPANIYADRPFIKQYVDHRQEVAFKWVQDLWDQVLAGQEPEGKQWVKAACAANTATYWTPRKSAAEVPFRTASAAARAGTCPASAENAVCAATSNPALSDFERMAMWDQIAEFLFAAVEAETKSHRL